MKVITTVKSVSKNNGTARTCRGKKATKKLRTPATMQNKEIFMIRDGEYPVFCCILRKSLSSKKVCDYNTPMVALHVEHFATGAYFILLLALVFFIALSTILIYFLSKALKRTLSREKEISVYSHDILLAQEDERDRLRRELHDTVIQDLRYLKLEINRIGKIQDAGEREKRCVEAGAVHSGVIRRLRDICDNLAPPDFQFQGLCETLGNLCFNFGKRTGIDCRIDITENINSSFPKEDKALQVFRIVQEALSNIEKHSEATEAIVIVNRDSDGTIYLGVSDDGKGFSFASNSRYNDSMGIRNMNERAAFLGGKLEINNPALKDGVCWF